MYDYSAEKNRDGTLVELCCPREQSISVHAENATTRREKDQKTIQQFVRSTVGFESLNNTMEKAFANAQLQRARDTRHLLILTLLFQVLDMYLLYVCSYCVMAAYNLYLWAQCGEIDCDDNILDFCTRILGFFPLAILSNVIVRHRRLVPKSMKTRSGAHLILQRRNFLRPLIQEVQGQMEQVNHDAHESPESRVESFMVHRVERIHERLAADPRVEHLLTMSAEEYVSERGRLARVKRLRRLGVVLIMSILPAAVLVRQAMAPNNDDTSYNISYAG